MSEVVKITGLKEFNNALANLAVKVSKEYARGAVGAGAKVIYDQTVANVPARSGRLKRAIYRAWIPNQSNAERQTFFVSVRRGKRYQARTIVSKKGKSRTTKNNDAYYWTWVEFPHLATGRTKIKGGVRAREMARGKMLREGTAKLVPGQGFMRRAYESKKNAAVDAIKDELQKRIFNGLPRV